MILLGYVLMLSHGNAALVTLPPADNDTTSSDDDESNVMLRSSNNNDDGKLAFAIEVDLNISSFMINLAFIHT